MTGPAPSPLPGAQPRRDRPAPAKAGCLFTVSLMLVGFLGGAASASLAASLFGWFR